MPKDQNETESKETFLSDFGKLSQGLPKEEREAALREVGQMQKEGLIVVEGDEVGRRRLSKLLRRLAKEREAARTSQKPVEQAPIGITKEQALQIYIDHETESLRERSRITDEPPEWPMPIYGFFGDPGDYWYIYPPTPFFHIGATTVVIISKKDGRIVFAGAIGE
jgi:hypothetical protein